jgi:hypothetical protein
MPSNPATSPRDSKPLATETPLAALLAKAAKFTGAIPSCYLTGKVVAFAVGAMPMIECPALDSSGSMPIPSLVPLDTSHIGRRVAIGMLCDEGQQQLQPVINGLLPVELKSAPIPPQTADSSQNAAAGKRKKRKPVSLTIDRDFALHLGNLTIDAKNITLAASGKVIVDAGSSNLVLKRGKIRKRV